jgi:hypothetical protein
VVSRACVGQNNVGSADLTANALKSLFRMPHRPFQSEEMSGSLLT